MAFLAENIPVNIPGSPYAVRVQQGLLSESGPVVAAISRSKKVGMVTDSHVGPLYGQLFCESLAKAGLEAIVATLPAGESHKTLGDMVCVFDRLLEARIDRDTPIVALGGGVTGDMTGFVAATILRGVPFIQAPTSLLAMVDASVGGKTGINHAVGKNLIGAFHQPIGVLIDPTVLKTLPRRELCGGLAECIKHDCIRDAAGFADIETNVGRALDLDLDYLSALVAHNVAIKARVVESDPFEKGERAHLNFGHTFGHAIETVSQYQYSHGEAVALGMAAAAHLSASLGLIDQDSRQRILAVIAKAGLPTAGLTLDTTAVVDAMAFDKKVKSGGIRFVLLDAIGHAVIRDDIPARNVRDAVESVRG